MFPPNIIFCTERIHSRPSLFSPFVNNFSRLTRQGPHRPLDFPTIPALKERRPDRGIDKNSHFLNQIIFTKYTIGLAQ